MKVISRSTIGCYLIPLCEFKFFRRICANLPEDGGSIGEGLPPVNDNRVVCQAKVEMSYSYRSRNVLFGQ